MICSYCYVFGSIGCCFRISVIGIEISVSFRKVEVESCSECICVGIWCVMILCVVKYRIVSRVSSDVVEKLLILGWIISKILKNLVLIVD